MVKNLPTVQEAWVQSLGWKDPLEKGMATHSQGQRSLAGYSPWGHTELDMTERLSHTHTHTHTHTYTMVIITLTGHLIGLLLESDEKRTL